jgi:hypothetical protein
MTVAALQPPQLSRMRQLIGGNPLFPLLLLLIALIGILEVMQPGIINPRWLGNTVKFAIPLAMLAACQTLTMSPPPSARTSAFPRRSSSHFSARCWLASPTVLALRSAACIR